MVNALAFDLETVPTEAALALPYPEASREPPATYSKPESIAAWREKDRESWQLARLKQYSLSPLHGRIVAVGMASVEDGTSNDIASTEDKEARLIDRLWARLAACDVIVTWNGVGFDLPFLLTRSALLGVTIPSEIDVSRMLRRYSSDPHYDVKAMVCQWDMGKMRDSAWSLGAVAAAFGLGSKTADGSAVYAMHMAGDHAGIGLYAAQDAALTLALYGRVRAYLR